MPGGLADTEGIGEGSIFGESGNQDSIKDHASMQTRDPEAKNQARDHQEKSVKCEEMTLDRVE